jgi:hypothetical protein
MFSEMSFSTERSAKHFDEVKVIKMANSKMAATKYVFSHF